jgi:DNA-binding NarL/FixJ family response regulator
MLRQPSQGLRVLLLEDDPRDAELIELTLQRDFPNCQVVSVEGRAGFVRALHAFRPDVVLSDHAVASFSVGDALRMVQARSPACPFFLVSGAYHGTVGECLKAGAADFVSKADLPRLPDAIRNSLELRAPLRKLSTRQMQIFLLLAAGISNREIARKLQLSIKTIETHRAQVLKRLGLTDLASLVRFAVRTGVISPG